MLRYDRQTKPGLVALYDIRPGNGASPFLQPGAAAVVVNFGNENVRGIHQVNGGGSFWPPGGSKTRN